MRVMTKKNWLVVLALIGLTSLSLYGVDYIWNGPDNGAWDDAAHWNPATGFPSSSADTASFTVASDMHITSSSNVDVGNMTFNSPNNYTLNLTGHTLTMDNPGGVSLIDVITLPLLTISAPLSTSANTSLRLNLGAGSSTVLSGPVSSSAVTGQDNLFVFMNIAGNGLTISGALSLSPHDVGRNSLSILNDSPNAITISGNISGSAGCNINCGPPANPNALVLSGDNSGFFGDMVISQFILLQLQGANSFGNTHSFTFGSGNSSINALASFSTGATFTIPSAATPSFFVGDTVSLTGVINLPANATLRKQSAGTLDIQSNNVASSLGTIDVQGGNLQLSQSGALAGPVNLSGASTHLEVDATATAARVGTLQGAQVTSQVVLNAPLRVDMNSAGVYAGQFVGTYGQGELDLYGPQTLQISGDSSSTMMGLVNIQPSGQLVMAGSAALGGPVNLADITSQLTVLAPATIGPLSGASGSQVQLSAPLTIDASFTPTTSCGCSIVGNANLTKTGPGIIDFRGLVVLSSGSFNVNEGTALINNGLSASGLTVAAGALLGGNGIITSPVVNVFGTLAPGNSIGTTSVNGSVVFLDGSTFVVEFAGTQSDLLDVTQNVTINPGSTIQFVPLGAPVHNHVYTAIQAGGVIGGTFSTVIVPAGFSLQLITSDPQLLQFIISQISVLSSVVNTGNPGQVAFYLDGQTNPSGDLSDIIVTLNALTSDPSALRNALNQLHPAAFSAFSLAQENLAVQSRSLYSERANELFYTSCGCAAPHGYCHGVWLDLLGDYRCENENGDQYGYKEGGFYAFVGTDCFTTSRINTGLSFGYARSFIDWTQVGWEGHMDSYSGAIYASDCFCGTMVDASLQLTYSHIDATRHIEFSDIIRNAKNDHDSWLWAAHLGLSQYYDCSCFSFIPFAYLDCVDVHEDHFSEQGADSIDLIVGNHRANMVRGELGFRLLDQLCWCCLRVIPSVSASVVQEWRYAGTIFNSQMEGAIGTFDVDGVNPDRTLFSPGAELLVLTCNDALSLTLRYQGEFGRRMSDNSGLLKMSYNF